MQIFGRTVKLNKFHLMLGVMVVVILAQVWWFGRSEEQIFGYLKQELESIRAWHTEYPVLFPLLYFLAYVAIITSLVPVDMFLMLLAGALFGIPLGTLISCTAHTMGASIAFYFSRRMYLRSNPEPQAVALAAKRQKDLWFYLFILRITPLVPAQGVSLMMGTLSVSLEAFFVTTWLGTLPMAVFFVLMGTRITEISHVSQLITPEIVGMLVAFIVFLLVGKYLLGKRGGAPV